MIDLIIIVLLVFDILSDVFLFFYLKNKKDVVYKTKITKNDIDYSKEYQEAWEGDPPSEKRIQTMRD